jgi:phosphoribosylaminoimidazole carboxylase (NCAIR synthetase)
MNFVFLSPHFPENYYLFAVHLNELGANVLGLADEPNDHLRFELRSALRDYYQVHDMHNYDQLLRACGYFTHRFGKLDRIDSFNEYWLESEAALRTDFNMFGIKTDEIMTIKRKSLMKDVFRQAGIRVAEGKIVSSLSEAKKLIKEIGFPVVAKPDIGVGAAKTYKIHNHDQLSNFFTQKTDVDYILEEFIQGDIITFDGLTDHNGNIVFFTSHKYSQGIMEVINNNDDVFYYSLRQIPESLENTGRLLVKAFDVRERFFHFEFFSQSNTNELLALEVNMRPPGGMTTDMFNYANDIDIYKEWAHVVVHNKFTAIYTRPYHCCYVGRKGHIRYAHSHNEIVSELDPSKLVHHQPISGIFSAALGNYGYLLRSPDMNDFLKMVEYIHKRG